MIGFLKKVKFPRSGKTHGHILNVKTTPPYWTGGWSDGASPGVTYYSSTRPGVNFTLFYVLISYEVHMQPKTIINGKKCVSPFWALSLGTLGFAPYRIW